MKELALKYGCNPNQKPSRIYMEEGELPIEVLNGRPGYINFLDALNSWQLVKELHAFKWKNREQLWNAVEAAEKTKDSRLAREFVVALPIELDKDSNISLLQNFIQKNFVDMGMCADFAIHDTDGHNPHAHILLTVRM